MSLPTVTIIIPTYKRSDFLERAIESVITQDYPYKEIIIVDDNGYGAQQEITKSIVAKYSTVTLKIYEKNQGACFARNYGAEHAGGEILMFLDDDDYFLPGKITEHIQPLKTCADVDMALCSLNIVDGEGVRLENAQKYPKGSSFKSFVLDGHVFTDMIAIRSQVFKELGGFDNIPRFQDKYFMYKFFKADKTVAFVSKELVVWTDHNEGRISAKNVQNDITGLKIIHEFEKANSSLFTPAEQNMLNNRFERNMAAALACGDFRQRFAGISHLMKCNWIKSGYAGIQAKILMRILLSDRVLSKIMLSLR